MNSEQGSSIENMDPADEDCFDPDVYKQARGPTDEMLSGVPIERFNDWVLMENLRLTNALYNRSLPGEASSTRRRFRRFHTFIKRTLVRMLGWYVNPAVENQHDFNAYITRTMNEIKSYLDHLQINEDILNTRTKRDLALFRAKIMFLDRQLEQRAVELENSIRISPAMQNGIDDTGWGLSLDPLVEKSANEDSRDLLMLMNLVYGSPRELRERYQPYLRHLKDCSNALVIGCGRGELLHVLKAEGIDVRGLETSAVLAGHCRDQGLEVDESETIKNLESIEELSLHAVLVTRHAPHTSLTGLMRLLRLCSRKLCDGGVLVIEAPDLFPLYASNGSQNGENGLFPPIDPGLMRSMCLMCGFLEEEAICRPRGAGGFSCQGPEFEVHESQEPVSVDTIDPDSPEGESPPAGCRDYTLVMHKSRQDRK